MKRILIPTLLLCVACGDAFELATLPLEIVSPEDGGFDVNLSKPRLDGSQELHDASAHDSAVVVESGSDTSVDSGTAVDSGSTIDAPFCTPVAAYTWSCGAFGSTITSVSQFCWTVTNSTGGNPLTTPSQCACKETYSCVCLGTGFLNQTCTSRGMVFDACQDSNGHLIVQCR